MVGEVCVHDDDKVSLGELEAMHVGGSQTEFARAGLEDDALLGFGVVGGDELFGDILGSVGRAVVDDDDFPVEGAVG